MKHASSNKFESSVQKSEPASRFKTPEEQIRFRAYQIYLARNGRPGRALEDWLQAERELQAGN